MKGFKNQKKHLVFEKILKKFNNHSNIKFFKLKLEKMIKNKALEGAPLLIVANKQDIKVSGFG